MTHLYDLSNMTHLGLHNENQFLRYQQREPTYIPPMGSLHLPSLMLLNIYLTETQPRREVLDRVPMGEFKLTQWYEGVEIPLKGC